MTSLLTILVTAAPCTEVADRGMHPVLTAVVMLGWLISLFASGRLWSRGVAFRFFPQAYGLLVGLLWGLSEGSSAKVIELSLVNLGLGWMFWLCLFVSTFEGPYDLSSPSSRLPVPTRHRDEAAAAKRHRVQLAGVMQILLAPPLAAAPCPDARDRVGPPHR